MRIIALGQSEFVLGFRLAGISTIETSETSAAQLNFEKSMEDPDIGIIITDDVTLESLPTDFREKVEAAVKPVTVVLSRDATSNETLRKKIKKSIGVDLWSD